MTEDRGRNEQAGQPEQSAQLAAALIAGANEMGLTLEASQARRLLLITTALADWNTRFNLTAITDPRAMLTHHLLDSLAAHAHLQGTRIADVGTGAGFPGLPLALLQPQRQFTLIDSVAKKLRFVAHAAQLADIHNITLVHARSQDFPRGYPPPHLPFDTVVARAFKPLVELVKLVQPLCGPATRVLAMKGPRADEEIAVLGGGWRVEKVSELVVPGLDAERKLVTLRLAGPV